ncbi:MAG: hypothetical protein PHY22_02530, partial [Acholeplasmataceae bacterium]|nr:hypothetical protein [Acholeplasmataceae bacterium]
PYINLGIILALAGLDYSNVVEPDFESEKVSQSVEVTNYLKKLMEEIHYNWKNKEKLALKKFQNKSYITEEKNIYYDTSNIYEKQTITYKKCDYCSGLIKITSKNNRNDKILAITIPLDACRECEKEGENLYHNSAKGDYDNIYLQNRIKDQYLKR